MGKSCSHRTQTQPELTREIFFSSDASYQGFNSREMKTCRVRSTQMKWLAHTWGIASKWKSQKIRDRASIFCKLRHWTHPLYLMLASHARNLHFLWKFSSPLFLSVASGYLQQKPQFLCISSQGAKECNKLPADLCFHHLPCHDVKKEIFPNYFN